MGEREEITADAKRKQQQDTVKPNSSHLSVNYLSIPIKKHRLPSELKNKIL